MNIATQIWNKMKQWLSSSSKERWEVYLEQSKDIYDLEYRQKQLGQSNSNWQV